MRNSTMNNNCLYNKEKSGLGKPKICLRNIGRG